MKNAEVKPQRFFAVQNLSLIHILSKQQAELEEIFKPINYTIEPSTEKCTYTFGSMKVQQYFPNIKFVTGRPREFSVIVLQDGEYLVAG